MKTFILSILFTTLIYSQGVARQATLTWEDNDNPSGTMYNAYRASGDCLVATGFTKLTPTPVTTKSYVDTTVTTGGKYCYYVTATLNDLESDPSDNVDARIRPRKVTNDQINSN